MRARTTARWWLPLLVVLALAAAACEGDPDANGGDTGDANGGGGDGGTVSVMSALTGDEAEAFRASFESFEEETGITVDFEEASQFETVLPTRVEGGNPPDIALFPQPGLMLDMAQQADATPLSEFMDMQSLEENIVSGFLDTATDDEGNTYGFPIKMANKSLLWYPVPEFEEAGYEVPETQEELEDLEQQIRDDGNTPWCLGMESGADTGWVGTDWIEDYMLRLHGADAYDAWVAGELDFQSEEVTAAWQEFGEVWQTEGNVRGGTNGMLNIPFGDSPNPMFEEEPGCYLHRQANFATTFFPEDVQENLEENVGVTYFPAFEGEDRPVLAGGDFAVMMNDTDAAQQFMEFMAQPEFGEEGAAMGGWLSPNVNFDTSTYPNDITRDIHNAAAEADLVRFDASDQMPGEVGAGSFWTGIVDWVSGGSDLEAVLQSIDESWPE